MFHKKFNVIMCSNWWSSTFSYYKSWEYLQKSINFILGLISKFVLLRINYNFHFFHLTEFTENWQFTQTLPAELVTLLLPCILYNYRDRSIKCSLENFTPKHNFSTDVINLFKEGFRKRFFTTKIDFDFYHKN